MFTYKNTGIYILINTNTNTYKHIHTNIIINTMSFIEINDIYLYYHLQLKITIEHNDNERMYTCIRT
jgi:hypothetical protein